MAINNILSDNDRTLFEKGKLLTIISEYAEGGAKHILEIRQTPSWECKFDSPDDYLIEILKR